MYQQPIAQTLSTKEFFRSLNSPIEDDRKLTVHDLLLTAAQVGAALVACGALHIAFV